MTPTNPIPPASAVPAPVPTEQDIALAVTLFDEVHYYGTLEKYVECVKWLIAAHVAAASRASVEQETAWLMKLCNAEGEAKERANNLIVQLRIDRETLVATLDRVRADRDKLAGELAASQGALASIKDLVSASDDFDADEVISLCEKQVGRFSQSKEWAMQSALKELEADLARVREELKLERAGQDALRDVSGNADQSAIIELHKQLTAERAAHEQTKAELVGALKQLGHERTRTGGKEKELQAQLDQARAEARKLDGFYQEIISEVGHDGIIKEYRQRGELLRDEARLRKEAQATATRHADLAKELATRLKWHVDCTARASASEETQAFIDSSEALARYNEAIKEGKTS